MVGGVVGFVSSILHFMDPFNKASHILKMLILLGFLYCIVNSDTIELPPAPDRSLIDDRELTKFGVNDEQRLFRHILRDYDLSVRPVFNASKTVIVYMGLTLTHIFNIDERNQVLALNVWVEQSWQDERIRWNPQEFGNITKLTVGVNYLWTPDIVLYNNARDFSRGFVDTNVHITFEGDIQWAPPAKVHSMCRLNVALFPFDDQFCVLEFGSWIYDQKQLDIEVVERYDGKAPFTIDSFTENGEWQIVANRTRKIVRGRNSVYPTILFELHLRRRVLYFIYNIIAPCVMLSILTMMQFMLPSESGEKVTLGLTVLLAYSVFSFNIAESMPETSEVIPLIAIYLMTIMGISGLSVCLSVIVLNMRHGAEYKCKVPSWLNFIAFRILARLVGTSGKRRKFLGNGTFIHQMLTQNLLGEGEETRRLQESIEHWNQVSNIFDRFFFCFVFLLTASSSIILLIFCPRFNNKTLEDFFYNSNEN
uniref:Uncharacterized protein n=1 Tax=Acrobeloides nanus TaxID=290746 RepID=A0A914BW61_9BILA